MYYAIGITSFIIGVILMIKTEHQIQGVALCTLPIAVYFISAIVGWFKTRKE